jgi:hypothetical protein
MAVNSKFRKISLSINDFNFAPKKLIQEYYNNDALTSR